VEFAGGQEKGKRLWPSATADERFPAALRAGEVATHGAARAGRGHAAAG
jgi:hypothetical protein